MVMRVTQLVIATAAAAIVPAMPPPEVAPMFAFFEVAGTDTSGAPFRRTPTDCNFAAGLVTFQMAASEFACHNRDLR